MFKFISVLALSVVIYGCDGNEPSRLSDVEIKETLIESEKAFDNAEKEAIAEKTKRVIQFGVDLDLLEAEAVTIETQADLDRFEAKVKALRTRFYKLKSE